MSTTSGRSRRLAILAAWSLAFVTTTTTAGSARAFVWPNVPEQVERGLASTDPSERRLAAQRLAELPPEIALRLAASALGDPDVEVRLRAADAAVARRLPRAGDQVISWLSDADPRLRLAACDVIRAAPTERSVVALGRVLGDPDPHVRRAAALAMGSSAMSEAVSPLLGHLDDPSSDVRQEIAVALGRAGDPRAVLPLIGKVQDSVPEVRRVVARALGDLGDVRAASALMLALQDAMSEVRLAAVEALGKLRSDEAVPVIAPLVDTVYGDASTRTVSAGAGTSTGEVRVAGLRALGRIGTDAAVKVLIGALAKEDPQQPRSAVRDALVLAGPRATTALIATLSGAPSSNTAAGAALALGALHATEGAAVVIRAMARGAVPLRHGLRALAQIGSSDALPAVLEVLDDADPGVRKEGIRAAIALLDPARIDGRPVDPARTALAEPATPIDEKIALCRMLGRTGAPRAQAVLLPLVSAKPIGLRKAVLEALGTLHASAPEVDRALMEALDDESEDVRLKAAVALSRVGSPRAADAILDRLLLAAEQDRGALGIAISGVLSRSTDPKVAARTSTALATAPEVARDALIEGLGRMRSADAGRYLAALASGGIDDRRKVAEALAGHPEAIGSLDGLAADPDPGVRANAVWSLGTVGARAQLDVTARLVSDPDAAVAAAAAAALARVAARSGATAEATTTLCTALSDARPYVRANALGGLSLLHARCTAAAASDLLARDPSESVRLAAADFLGREAFLGDAKTRHDNQRALTRCVNEERDVRVAVRCAHPLEVPTAVDDVAIYVVPDGRSVPAPRAPFALVRSDGLLRLGLADRRGELFEFGAPKGVLRLGVPAALAR